jgi:hypothetical protein
MGRADRKTVLPAKATTSTGQKKIEDMPGDSEEVKAGVSVAPRRNGKHEARQPKYSHGGKTVGTNNKIRE